VYRPHAARALALGTALLLVACREEPALTRPDLRSRAADSARVAREDERPTTIAASVRINEVESNLGVPGDWVELHNRAATPFDLGGHVFRDNDDSRGYVIPAGTIIPANGFLVLDEAQFGFGLGASDQARLFAPDGTTLVDGHTWTAHATTTWARCPDGTGNFVTASIVTKGSANDCAPLARINEIESSGGTPGDWIELLNTTAAALDLGGHIVRDDRDEASYVIPAGTSLAPGAYLVLEEAQLGFALEATDAVRLFRPNGTALVDGYTWTTHAATSYGRCPDGAGGFAVTAVPTKGAANACDAPTTLVRINEVESNFGTPGDWVELFNTGNTSVDLSGYVFRDNNDQAAYVLPAGSVIAAGGYLVLDEAQFGFGLGGNDAARLFGPGGVVLVDSYAWTEHATTTYGRCPNGTGSFTTTAAPTRGAANDCSAGEQFDPWPGDPAVADAEPGNAFGGNMSGLHFEQTPNARGGIVWAVKNGPGTLYQLVGSGGTRVPPAGGDWSAGKALRYPDGMGDADAEGVTRAGAAIYVAAERNNANSAVSRNSILRYDPSTPGTVLVATREWNLTADLPPNGANLGLEAIAFVPDAFLVQQGFRDEARNAPYDPSVYPNNAGGVFFVGVEGTGMVHGYALDHASGGFTRVATFASGFPTVMELAFDAELGQLWAICDNTCNGRSTVLRIAAVGANAGRFAIRARFERPTGMPNLNNEGFTFLPLARCSGGRRQALWADDGNTGGIALRSGTVSCTAF
jgi:hypothetical protein